jgi:hypothetical protein
VEFPDDRIEALWIAADGAGLVARSGDRALVAWRKGDGYVARDLPWAAALAATVAHGRVRLKTGRRRAAPGPRGRRLAAARFEPPHEDLRPRPDGDPVLRAGRRPGDRPGPAGQGPGARYEARDTATSLVMGLGSSIAGR